MLRRPTADDLSKAHHISSGQRVGCRMSIVSYIESQDRISHPHTPL